MTKPKLVFSPVFAGVLRQSVRDLQADARRSSDLLRRARGLLRADPARRRGGGVQGPRLVLVGPRMRPGHGAVRRRAAEVDHLHGPAGPSPHAQPAQQGVHARVPIQSQRETVVELVEHYLAKVDPDNFDVVQDFSGPFPVEVITRMAGVPEEFRQQVRHWIDKGLERKPGQIELERRKHAGQHRLGRLLLRPGRRSGANDPAGRHDQPPDRRGDP